MGLWNFAINRIKKKLIHYDENKTYERAEFLQKLIKTRYPAWNVWARLVKTKLYQKSLPFFENVDKEISPAEDSFQSLIFFNLAQNFALVDKDLYFYRLNSNSSVNSKDITKRQKNIQANAKAVATIKEALLQYPFLDKKLAKLWLNLLTFLEKRATRQLKKDQGALTFKDKLSFFFDRIIFVTKRKIRMKFGVVL